MNKHSFRDLSYGVYIVTSLDGKRPVGCIANSIMQITSTPSTFAVSINRDNYTNKCMSECEKFAISILPETANPSLIGTFGFSSSRDNDKFSDVLTLEKEGLSVIAQAKSFIVCRVTDKMEASTHTVFLGEAIDADVLSESPVMTYDYYHKVIKGKSPKNAPTFIEEERAEGEKSLWKCSICGYVYDGEATFEDLPESFNCPVCGVPKSMFEKA